jgi:hypothetical protein
MSSAVKRYSTIKIDRVTLDEYGFLRTEGNATRVGVFRYLKSDGSIILELRHPDEVFKADSVRTLRGVPVTNRHPTEGVVNSKNAKNWQVGYTGDVKVDDPFIKAEVTITSDEGIQAVQNGTQELSCGYQCELDYTPGEWNGLRYDAIQRNIRYNHLAIVDQGRAGSSVRLKLDAEGAIEVADDVKVIKEEKIMKKVKLGTKEFECDNELAEAIEAQAALSETAVAEAKAAGEVAVAESAAKIAEGEAALGEEKAKCDALQAKVDHLEKDKNTKTDADEVKALVRERLKLERVASLVLDSATTEKMDTLSDKEIKVAVIKADRSDFSDEGKSDVYIDAAFDLAVESVKKKNREDVGSKVITATDGSVITADQARAKSMEESKNAWKQPLSAAK